MTRDIRVLKELQEDRQYESIDTCAVDGVCSWSCPVGINTGEFVKQQREQAVSDGLLSAGRLAKNNWSSVETLVRGSRSLRKDRCQRQGVSPGRWILRATSTTG